MNTRLPAQPSVLTKYLARFGETECQALEDFPGHYHHGLVVPIYREQPMVLERLVSFADQHPKTLLVLVINRPDDDHDTLWSRAFLSLQRPVRWQSRRQHMTLVPTQQHPDQSPTGSAVLLVDRCDQGQPIARNLGVGLARKIGADILCTLIHQQKVCSPWIFNTDADAYLPDNYFAAAEPFDAKTAAIIYPFEHCFLDTELAQLPTLLYEFSLHYYVHGLSLAGSPYAYHTLGSTIAINYQHYANVRGIPRRAGAEDFYVLNKLAKTGQLVSLNSPLIRLAARESTRVPFGTGPAVKNLAASATPTAMAIYHPHCFSYLAVFLTLLDSLSDYPHHTDIDNNWANMIDLQNHQNLHLQPLLDCIEHFDLNAAVEHCFVHGKSKAARLKHFHQWFDAFKTLKFIHRIRDKHLGTIPFAKWLKDQSHENNNHTINTLIRKIEAIQGG